MGHKHQIILPGHSVRLIIYAQYLAIKCGNSLFILYSP